jgi:exonuclease III
MYCLTYNVYFDGDDYDLRLTQIIKFIQIQKPDIITLQEVKYGSYRKIINELSEYNYVLDKRIEFNRMYGELILTKFKINRCLYFSYGDTVRGITVYETDKTAIVTTHFEHNIKEKFVKNICSVLHL